VESSCFCGVSVSIMRSGLCCERSKWLLAGLSLLQQVVLVHTTRPQADEPEPVSMVVDTRGRLATPRLVAARHNHSSSVPQFATAPSTLPEVPLAPASFVEGSDEVEGGGPLDLLSCGLVTMEELKADTCSPIQIVGIRSTDGSITYLTLLPSKDRNSAADKTTIRKVPGHEEGTCKYHLGCGRDACAFKLDQSNQKDLEGLIMKPLKKTATGDNELYFNKKIWSHLGEREADMKVFADQFIRFYGHVTPNKGKCILLMMENGGGQDLGEKGMAELGLTKSKDVNPISVLSPKDLSPNGHSVVWKQLTGISYLMQDILKGLLLLSQLQVVHRDLKCDNVMLNFGEEGGTKVPSAKLFDWGHSSDDTEPAQDELRRRGLSADQLGAIGLINWRDAIRPPEGRVGKKYEKFPLWSLDMFMAGGILVQLMNGNVLPKVVKVSELELQKQVARGAKLSSQEAMRFCKYWFKYKDGANDADFTACEANITSTSNECIKNNGCKEEVWCAGACDGWWKRQKAASTFSFTLTNTCIQECKPFLETADTAVNGARSGQEVVAPIPSLSCGHRFFSDDDWDGGAQEEDITEAGGPMYVTDAKAMLGLLRPGCLLPDPTSATGFPLKYAWLEQMSELAVAMSAEDPAKRISPYVALSHPALTSRISSKDAKALKGYLNKHMAIVREANSLTEELNNIKSDMRCALCRSHPLLENATSEVLTKCTTDLAKEHGEQAFTVGCAVHFICVSACPRGLLGWTPDLFKQAPAPALAPAQAQAQAPARAGGGPTGSKTSSWLGGFFR